MCERGYDVIEVRKVLWVAQEGRRGEQHIPKWREKYRDDEDNVDYERYTVPGRFKEKRRAPLRVFGVFLKSDFEELTRDSYQW